METATADEVEFVTLEGVPIFHECVSLDEKGNPEPVTPEIIDHIADINNARSAAGEPAVIHVGHTDGTDNEKPVLGFLDRYTTGFRNDVNGVPKKTLFANYRVYSEKRQELKYFPRRSVEIYQSDAPESKRWVITSLALVGSNEPALKLGVMYRATDQRGLAKFTMEHAMVPDELKAQILDVLSQTDVFAWAHGQMKSSDVSAEESAAQNTENADESAADETAKEEGADETKSEESQTSDDKGDEAVSDENKKKDETEKYTALAQEHADLKKKFRDMERRGKLVALENEGHVGFSVEDELKDTDELNDAQFDKHIERVRKFTKRAPLAMNFSVAGVDSGGDTTGGMSPDKIKAVQKYARDNKVSFETALAACK